MGFVENISTCHRCDYSRGCHGACPCKADPQRRDISELATANICPAGLFGDGLPAITEQSPAAEVAERLLKPIPFHMPAGWQLWPNVRAAHGELLARLTQVYEWPWELFSGDTKTRRIYRALHPFPHRLYPTEIPAGIDLAKLEAIRRHEPPLIVTDLHYGDLLNLMPAMKWVAGLGRKVKYLTGAPFGELVDGLPWVEWVRYEGPYDYEKARDHARTLGEVIEAKRSGKWALESWSRTGVDEALWYTLPLEIENRLPEREAALVASLVRTNKPLIVTNYVGWSSPYPHADTMHAHLVGKFKGCEVVDISGFKAEKFQDLCGLFARANVVVTVDTGTLHLTYATRTPTIALLPDKPWNAAPARDHWKLSILHDDSITPDGLQAIDDAITEVLADNLAPMRFTPSPDLSGIPLAGDAIEKLAKAVGADKLAAAWERLTGRPCGCGDRKAWLNQKSRELLAMFGFVT